MTNPNNAVGTNGAFGGRTSVNAFNDGLAAYSSGILSGWACSPDTGLTVVLGGDGNTRDVAIAEDNAGNKTTINNISGTPVSVTVGNAPNNNSRIDSIVAYVDNPPTGSSTVTDNYGACGLIVVAGTVASTPTAPTESTIRTAITADGASGTTAYYVVLANVTIASGTTSITSSNIQAGVTAAIHEKNLNLEYSTTEINTGSKWIDGGIIYKKTISLGSLPNNDTKNVQYNIPNFGRLIKLEGSAHRSSDNADFPLPFPSSTPANAIAISVDNSLAAISVVTGTNRSNMSGYITLYYTKTS